MVATMVATVARMEVSSMRTCQLAARHALAAVHTACAAVADVAKLANAHMALVHMLEGAFLALVLALTSCNWYSVFAGTGKEYIAPATPPLPPSPSSPYKAPTYVRRRPPLVSFRQHPPPPLDDAPAPTGASAPSPSTDDPEWGPGDLGAPPPLDDLTAPPEPSTPPGGSGSGRGNQKHAVCGCRLRWQEAVVKPYSLHCSNLH